MFFETSNVQVTFVDKSQLQIISFPNINIIFNSDLTRQIFVNRALPSLHGGSFKITLLVPLIVSLKIKLKIKRTYPGSKKV